jgi:hypothetical protein
MMGLQAAIKSTTKRKYEIETDCEAADKKEQASPPKTLKFSDVTSKVLSPITNNKNNTNNNNNNNHINGTAVVKSIKSDIIPPETHQWGSNEPIVDSISKLQAVTETWSNTTLSTIPFNCTSSTLTSLAQTAENITRSTLATTLLDQDDLSEDEDDFQDDFDFDDEDDDDLLLDDHTVITTNHNYTPIRYPAPSPTRQNYIPAYPKPGYAPENYQNCSRTPIVAQQYTQQQQQQQQSQPHLRPSFFHGTNNGASWNYYNHHHHHHHQHHYDIGSHQQPQTIRCAENGKSYFELGSSSNYCGSNGRICNNGMMKNCCEGRNNLWCTAKQCYKEKRLKMMNLSMFKLARFRQASDQSLYRSVLICNTLKSLEKEIEQENQTYHQRMQQQHRQALQQQQSSMEFLQSFSARQQQQQQAPQPQQQQQQPNSSEPNKQQQQQNSSNNSSSSNSSNSSSLSTCNNTSFSQPYTNNCIINRIPSFDPMPIYEHHPLKDPSSGRATPFPTSPGISQLASNSTNSDTDSAFGDIDDVDSSSTRSIDWGSVLSLSSQSALDPLSNNDIFTSSTSTSLTQTSSTITNLHVTISNGGNNSTTSSSPNTSNTSTVSSASSTPISSIITTLTTVSSCSLESLTASSISVSQNVSNSNWDFPYIGTESSNNSDYYELNCYKLSSALNQMDDFVKSDQLMSSGVSAVVVSQSSTNDLEQLGTHIMVGS